MKLDKQTLFLTIAVLAAVCLIANVAFRSQAQPRQPRGEAVGLEDIPFDGQRAFEMLEKVCAIGPRVSGTDGMRRQQQMLREHFEKLGAVVTFQRFTARHPRTGEAVEFSNLIVTWHPERPRRILLCAHYDTRPFPDNDPDPAKRKGVFLGANDGGSGVALLAELGTHMPKFQSKYGVDFVLFDGEELVYDDDDTYFLGSTYFAKNYKANPPEHEYLAGVLFDMVADRDLNLFQEGHSVEWRKPRAIVHDIWRTAKRLGVVEFIPTARHKVRDDHLPLNQIAKIPTIDVIDFDYGPAGLRGQNYWHTTHDTPDKCSPVSLAKVGWVIDTWLNNLE
jgi:glutaminyl-peptide cyclotransferase